MKLQIELTENQLNILIDALESRFRWMLPQQSHIAIEPLLCDVVPRKDGNDEKWHKAFNRWLDRKESAMFAAETLQHIIYGKPYVDKYPSHGNVSDMWSVLRHTQWEMLDEKPEFFDVRGDEPIQLGDEPLMKVEVIEK